MSAHFYQHIRQQLAIAQQEGLFKKERTYYHFRAAG